MKKILVIFVIIALHWNASAASAGEFGKLRTQFSAARSALVVMIFHKDLRGPEQQKLVKDTADAVSASLLKFKVPAGKEAKFLELVNTWNLFKETREKELVPALLKGDEDKARAIVWGVQKFRFTKCMLLLRELDSDSTDASFVTSADIEDFRVKLNIARDSLLVMLHHKDKRGPEQQQRVKDTADAVSAQLDKMIAPPGKEEAFNELVKNWKAFRQIREQELVPAILEGKDEEALKIAYGVQQNKLKKCVELAGEVDK